MGYQILTTLVLTLHFGYLAYVVVGGFVAWRWPRTIWAHLVAAAWGLAVVGIPLQCPLTWVEDWSRRRAGQGGLTAGFVDRYIEGVLYPERYTRLLQALVAVTVVGSYVGFFLLRVRPPAASGRSGAEPTVKRPESGGMAASGRSGAEPTIKRPESGGTAASGRSGAEPTVKRPESGGTVRATGRARPRAPR